MKNDEENEESISKDTESIDLKSLVDQSVNFIKVRNELLVSTRLSLTGITNLVVNYEDPYVIDTFLNSCFKKQDLYYGTIDIDAVELQKGNPGSGNSSQWIDELIYGAYEMESKPENIDIPTPKIDPRTGKRKRLPDGFVSRKAINENVGFVDKTLIIKNIDYCMDFCQVPGIIDARALWIFDKFRNVHNRKTYRLLLVTNKPLIFPFKVLTVTLPPVNKDEANHVINSFVSTYKNKSYVVDITPSQKEQMIRKLSGLTYTQAGDMFGSAMMWSKSAEDVKTINGSSVLKNLRKKINESFMQDGFGLTHLTPKPWEDYICPESSNFTYDVKKIMRDFKEIEKLKLQSDNSVITDTIEAIQIRIPHIFVLYGKGGTGKSAFPIHLAGLLDFDVWDFNINAIHSKWIGEGSKQMRETLRKISSTTHVIIRIDEYDRAMGSTTEGGQGMHESHKQVESEFMNWLQNSQEEGLFVKNNIIVVLTTNHKDNITGPLLRSGRADLVIDIDNFDVKSMKEAIITSPRRMRNRGIKVLGFTNIDFKNAISELDLDNISELCTKKGFTVRDIETLLMEMSAHNYYYKINGYGLKWSSDNFIKVLENSQGSMRDSSTGELVLGDRQILMEEDRNNSEIKDTQMFFGFMNKSIVDPLRKLDLEGFKEI